MSWIVTWLLCFWINQVVFWDLSQKHSKTMVWPTGGSLGGCSSIFPTSKVRAIGIRLQSNEPHWGSKVRSHGVANFLGSTCQKSCVFCFVLFGESNVFDTLLSDSLPLGSGKCPGGPCLMICHCSILNVLHHSKLKNMKHAGVPSQISNPPGTSQTEQEQQTQQLLAPFFGSIAKLPSSTLQRP